MDQHYNPQIYTRLRTIFAAADMDALTSYLNGLSNAHFRTAGYIIGERLMPEMETEMAWKVMLHLVQWEPKAFLVTLAKATALRLKARTLSLSDDGFRTLAANMQGEGHVIDREKLLLQWLPVLEKPDDIEGLFTSLNTDNRRRIDFLLRTDGVAAGYVLLRTLRMEEQDIDLLKRTCTLLIKKGNALSFNFASIIKEYFGLDTVRGVFSLQIHPYELSRLDTDFETFCRVAKKV
ncbi:MAG: hypothetical protein K6F94_02345 [Bacteroidaceae bacterium]|nr:hypothetical protein [Bacteroidaceae bacterium]